MHRDTFWRSGKECSDAERAARYYAIHFKGVTRIIAVMSCESAEESTCLTMAWISEVISPSDFSGAGFLHMRAHVSNCQNHIFYP